jgi:hypothetical protein
MPRGSKPGAHRGGHQKGTPKKPSPLKRLTCAPRLPRLEKVLSFFADIRLSALAQDYDRELTVALAKGPQNEREMPGRQRVGVPASHSAQGHCGGRSTLRYSMHRSLRGARSGRADKSSGFSGFPERPMVTGPSFSSYRSGRGSEDRITSFYISG